MSRFYPRSRDDFIFRMNRQFVRVEQIETCRDDKNSYLELRYSSLCELTDKKVTKELLFCIHNNFHPSTRYCLLGK